MMRGRSLVLSWAEPFSAPGFQSELKRSKQSGIEPLCLWKWDGEGVGWNQQRYPGTFQFWGFQKLRDYLCTCEGLFPHVGLGLIFLFISSPWLLCFPPQVVQPTAWATVLALVWLHQYKWKVSWSDLLQAKACRWLQDQEGKKILLGGVKLRTFPTKSTADTHWPMSLSPRAPVQQSMRLSIHATFP